MYTDKQYEELYNLNKYQIKAIKKRVVLDFDKEKNKKSEEKNKFSKSFRNNIDVLIEDLLEKGVKFYALTFNLPEFKSKEWEVIHRRMEEIINYSMKNIEMIEFMYLSIEKHTGNKKKKENKKYFSNKSLFPVILSSSLKDVPHIHCIMGVRNLLQQNTLSSIREIYNQFNDDTKIDFLKNFKNIKAYWNYVVKENNFLFHRFVHFSKYHQNLYGSLSELEVTWGEDDCYDLGFYEGALFSEIKGVEGIKKNVSTICINLLNIYFTDKALFVNNDEIFNRVLKSKFSYKTFNSLNWLDKNNIQIFSELKLKFYQQLKKLKIDDFLILCWENVFKLLLKKNQYLPSIEFSNDVIEFTDGLYFLNYNYFLNYKDNKLLFDKMSKLNCYKFFDESYIWCKNNQPFMWLSAIKKTLPENKFLDDFCADLGRYFHSRKIFNKKKKTLCIKGSSNTGKTTLVANIIASIAGPSNIGIIGKGDQFSFEQIEDKKIIICDEFEYKEEIRGNLLKFMDGDPMLLNKKNEKKKLHVNEVPILFMFNEEINAKMLDDQSFVNRLLIYTFTYEYQDQDSDINDTLKKELPQIMIYCNDLFFNKNKKILDQDSTSKIYRYRKKEINDYLHNFIVE